jgi:hypothetical protein
MDSTFYRCTVLILLELKCTSTLLDMDLLYLILMVLPRQFSLFYLLCNIYLLSLYIYVIIIILYSMVILMLHLLRIGCNYRFS